MAGQGAEPSGKRIAEFASTTAAILAVVVASIYLTAIRTTQTEWALLSALIGCTAAMAFAFAGGFQTASGAWARRRAVRLIRRHPDLVAQLEFLAQEVYGATASDNSRTSTFGYNAFYVQQALQGAVEPAAAPVAEKAMVLIQAWTSSDGARKATKETVLSRCRSDAARSSEAFCQALEETRQLAVSAQGAISAYLYLIRQGLPSDKVGQDMFDNWATFAGRVNQYQTQLSYLVRDANTLFDLGASEYFRPVPPWLWLRTK
jgi:hypothetical protein